MAHLMDIVKKGSTDRSVALRIVDSGDGTPETGVVYNTSGIDLWYRREGAAKTSITEASLSALTDAHSDGGFLHVGDGEYRLDLPDAAFASGANYVDIGGTVTGMIVIGGRVRLVNYDPEDGVRAGLTALPNAAAEAAGGLYTRGTGAGQINQDANGRIDAHLNDGAHGGSAAVLTFERLVGVSTTSNQPSISLTGNGSAPAVRRTGGSTAAGEESTAGAFANTGGAIFTGKGSGPGLGLLAGPTGHGLWALGGSTSGDGIRAENVGTGYDINASLQGSVSGTVGGIAGTLQTLDSLWSKIKKWLQLALRKDSAIATDNATELSEINADGGSGSGAFANTTDSGEARRDNVGTAGAGLTAIPWNAAWDAEVQSEVDDALDSVIADSVAADGSRPSVRQALLMITRFLFERSVVSTTLTVKKEDGSTSSMTFTLNDATSPTSLTRAS